MFQNVNKINLNEEILSKENKTKVINNFVKYADQFLGLNGNVPEIKISYDDEIAKNMKSFGKYTPETNELLVVAMNRNLGDVLRTIAHELVHRKQHKEDKLDQNSNNTGSEHENEANALAGVMLREFGKQHPEIFE